MNITIRPARPSDAPFLAKCIMAGMHFYDFETDIPKHEDIYRKLIECEKRDDMLYTYKNTIVAEVDGEVAGSLLSYPGDDYSGLREKTFAAVAPDFLPLLSESEQETDPGEYYLDSLAVAPAFRKLGIGRMLIKEGIRKGQELGFEKICLVADSSMPKLISLYESMGFVQADRRTAFGVVFQRMIYTEK